MYSSIDRIRGTSSTYRFQSYIDTCIFQNPHLKIRTIMADSIRNMYDRSNNLHGRATVAPAILCALDPRVCTVTNALVQSGHPLIPCVLCFGSLLLLLLF